MTKNIFLCRHAHTPAAQPGQPDFDRELSVTGIQEARQAGNFIKSQNLLIDLFFSSAAVRAQQTARQIAEVIQFDEDKLKSSQELYYPKPATLLQTLTTLPETVQTIILVSHNPAVSDLVSKFAGSKVYVPTAGCNLIISEASEWSVVEWFPFRLKINY
jgi:phosphohistidine phosphatase